MEQILLNCSDGNTFGTWYSQNNIASFLKQLKIFSMIEIIHPWPL